MEDPTFEEFLAWATKMKAEDITMLTKVRHYRDSGHRNGWLTFGRESH